MVDNFQERVTRLAFLAGLTACFVAILPGCDSSGNAKPAIPGEFASVYVAMAVLKTLWPPVRW